MYIIIHIIISNTKSLWPYSSSRRSFIMNKFGWPSVQSSNDDTNTMMIHLLVVPWTTSSGSRGSTATPSKLTVKLEQASIDDYLGYNLSKLKIFLDSFKTDARQVLLPSFFERAILIGGQWTLYRWHRLLTSLLPSLLIVLTIHFMGGEQAWPP